MRLSRSATVKTQNKSQNDAPNDVSEMSVVLVAAGQSTRMHGVDKLMLPINGRPVLRYSLEVLNESVLVRDVVVVAHPRRIGEFQASVYEGGFSKLVRLVPGGNRRQDSVRNGILELLNDPSPMEFVAVHDAARPFIDAALLERGLTVAKRIGAAIPVIPTKDTIKRVEHGLVVETPDREGMYSVQTPQIFRTEILQTAHEIVAQDVTDDASMVEIAGGIVGTFAGSNDNIKITTQSDIPLANAIASNRTFAVKSQFGIGFDAHKLVNGGPLRLGGTDIEFDMHLEGHSDGDVLFHAISSAILGAAGLGDLGSNFPSSDPRYAGFDSKTFIQIAAAKAVDHGWRVDHVDATVIAQRPRLAPHRNAFEVQIANALDTVVDRVNVKVTSTDEVGAIGQGDGIAAQAIATLVQ